MTSSFGILEIEPERIFEKDTIEGILRFTRLEQPAEIHAFLEKAERAGILGSGNSIPPYDASISASRGGLLVAIELSGKPAGALYAIPAFTSKAGFHHHCSFLGIKPELQGQGYRKEARRLHFLLARRRGIKLITWTADPLDRDQAELNFRILAAVSRTYLPDFCRRHHPESAPGDRLLVEWDLESELVKKRLEGEIPCPQQLAAQYATELAVVGGRRGIEIRGYCPHGPTGKMLLSIPRVEDELHGSNPSSALAGEMLEFRETVTRLFRKGYAITGMIPAGARDELDYYILEKGL